MIKSQKMLKKLISKKKEVECIMKGARSIWFKSLAVFLVIVIVIAIFPMSVFATEYQNHKTLTTVDTETDADLIIKEEVVEERTEIQKHFYWKTVHTVN